MTLPAAILAVRREMLVRAAAGCTTAEPQARNAEMEGWMDADTSQHTGCLSFGRIYVLESKKEEEQK